MNIDFLLNDYRMKINEDEAKEIVLIRGIKEKEHKRMYYLKFKDGSVKAFDSKEKRDRYRDYYDAKTLKAHDFFDELIATNDIGVTDTLDIDDVNANIEVEKKRASLL